MAVVALLMVLSLPVGAQAVPATAREPPWLVYERARERLEAGELGEALELYLSIRPSGHKAPEVEMAVGDIFRLQAEPGLAEWHYRKALELAASLEVADDRYTVRYRLADMFRQLGRYDAMEKELLAVLELPAGYPFGRLRDDVARVFRSEGPGRAGIDGVMVLYRVTGVHTARAHSGLAWYYSRAGRPAEAVEHALFSMVIVLSEAIEEFQSRQPSYNFESVSRFLALAAKEPDILEFLRQSTLPGDIYSLGVALNALGEGESAVLAWHLLGGSPLEGSARNLADRQLDRPFPERLPPPPAAPR